MSSQRLPSVQRLIGLARSNGIDVRPTLLRIIVDQFVAETHHSAAEVTRFGELVVNLLPKASEADRILVAAKLARHRQTPAVVARRLAADTGVVARLVLTHCRALSDDDLFLAVRSGDPLKALAVAEREDIGLAALVALEDMEDPVVKAALAARIGRSPVPSREPLMGPPVDIGRRFLAAATAQRETMLAELALSQPALPPGLGPRGAAKGQGQGQGQEIEVAALSRREGALAEAIGRTFGLDRATAARIADDTGGELLVVSARALDLGREATTRILLFSHEAIGTSVERIYALAALYDAVPRGVAVTLVRAWQEAAPLAPPVRTVRHQPALAPDASDRMGARQAASPAPRQAARSPAVRPAASRLPKGS
ncbi:MAG: hypothetical protein Q8O26_05645 [Phreatobacter sp.]|uniref:hypothetical protein n=1 Tax=Phreatobacter sp. TaxID=1966341 RepID=UPI00273275F9|nr:hypothetical protein [Phreatobacter sp.]MDP2801350.1 hypothetical protein [Phreatobacter sp.]